MNEIISSNETTSLCEYCKAIKIDQNTPFKFKTNFRQTLSDHGGNYTAAREAINRYKSEHHDKFTKCNCDELHTHDTSATLKRDRTENDLSAELPREILEFLEITQRNGPQTTSLLSLCSTIQTDSDINHSREKLWNVTELNLHDGKIDQLPECVGAIFPNLQKIVLERNGLTHLPSSIMACDGLEYLQLRKNRLEHLPTFIGSLTKLEHLDLSDNSLRELSDSLLRLKHLTYLNLSGNGLAALFFQPVLDMQGKCEVRITETCEKRVKVGSWVEVINPENSDRLFYNKTNGIVSNTKPGRLLKNNCGQNESKNGYVEDFVSKNDPIAYQERKKKLALYGIREWVACYDDENDKPFTSFTNSISGEMTDKIPEILDTLGNLKSLVCLKVNDNKMNYLPNSIIQLSLLEVLEIRNNELDSLPVDIGNLTHLKVLKLDRNNLKSVPGSLQNCSKLRELDMTMNIFDNFPECIVELKDLHIVNLGNNAIKKIPYLLGFLEHLEELNLYNNPIEDPPYEFVMHGIERTLWECRQRFWVQSKGEVPKMTIHTSGIGNECIELEPSFRNSVLRMICHAEERTHILNLQCMNLSEIPEPLVSAKNIKKLNISGNPLGLSKSIVWSKNDCLKSLILKNCSLTELCPSIKCLRNLVDLNLEGNSLQTLPDTFTRLYHLQYLYLSNNKLHSLPDSIGEMIDLVELRLDCNFLKDLPDGIGLLRNLTILSASQNELQKIVDTIADNLSLSTLNLCQNKITSLPPRIGSLKLAKLFLSHNLLGNLSDDIFYSLSDSLYVLKELI